MTPDTPKTHAHPYLYAAAWTLLALAPLLLWWVSNPARQVVFAPGRFVFLHTAIEICAVVVAMLVFVTGYRAILSARKGAVVLLGVAFLGVGLFDFLHVLSYAGMPDAVTANSAHKSMFFWLGGRILAALALLAYALSPSIDDVTSFKKRLAVAAVLLMVGSFGYLGLTAPERVPALFLAGQGLTPLKVGLEWFIIAINLATALVLWRQRNRLADECIGALILSAVMSAVSEVFFTQLGVIDQDGANLVGHVYKIAAYLYLFHATFAEALRRPLQRLETQHAREVLILNAAPDGVLWVDQAGVILMANDAMLALTGYTPKELTGQNVDIFLPAPARGRHALSIRQYFTSPHPRAMGSSDLHLRRRDGHMLPVDISLGAIDDGGLRHAIAYIRDLTERKEYEESLRYQATHDELTGLPNRWLFHSQLEQAVARGKRSGMPVAVMLVDLDYFKTVNDSFGHPTGDALLVQVGARIRDLLRENDILARLGGDEFAIVLSELRSADEAINVAAKLIASLQASFRLQGQDLYSGGSLGLAFYPGDAQDSETLLRYADMAMYQAKQAGRGAFACYSADMDRRAHDDMQLHTRLKEAMTKGILKLHYQPQVDVRSGAVVGAEALLRWSDPVLGDVSPARFIPVAEATGLILPLSEWVLETACRQVAAWTQAGTPLRVAVNFSAQQFRQGRLHEKVAAVLARTGAQARWLCVEITESVAMTHPEQARVQLTALVSLGCSIALDDFGTGYSSLAYLKTLPVSKLKIDRSFMVGIPEDANDVALSRAIIALAHSLGMTLVAEGVETDAQLAFLREHGCEAYQGWLFAKAVDAREMQAFLPARHEGGAAAGPGSPGLIWR